MAGTVFESVLNARAGLDVRGGMVAGRGWVFAAVHHGDVVGGQVAQCNSCTKLQLQTCA